MADNHHINHDMQQNGRQNLDESSRCSEAGKQTESASTLYIPREEDPWADIDEIIDLSQRMRLRKSYGDGNTRKYPQGSRERQSGDDGLTIPTGTVSGQFGTQDLKRGNTVPTSTTVAYTDGAEKTKVISESSTSTLHNTSNSHDKREDVENLHMPWSDQSQFAKPEFDSMQVFSWNGTSESDTNEGPILPLRPSYRADMKEQDAPGIYFFAVHDDGSMVIKHTSTDNSSPHHSTSPPRPPVCRRDDEAPRKEDPTPCPRMRQGRASNQVGPGNRETNITCYSANCAASSTTEQPMLPVPGTVYHHPRPCHQGIARIIGHAAQVQPTRLVRPPKALSTRRLVHHSMETRPFFRCQELGGVYHPADGSPVDSIQRPVSAGGRRVSTGHSAEYPGTFRTGTSMGSIQTGMVNSRMVHNDLTTRKHRHRPRGVKGELRPALTCLETPHEIPEPDDRITCLDPRIPELPPPQIHHPKSVNLIQVTPYRDPDSHLTTETEEDTTRPNSSSSTSDRHSRRSTDDHNLGQTTQNKGKLRRRLGILRERLQSAGRRLFDLATSCTR